MHLDLLFGSSGESHIYIFILSATCPVPHDGAFAQEENDLCHPPVRPITQTAHLQSRLDRVERYWMKQVKAHIPREKNRACFGLDTELHDFVEKGMKKLGCLDANQSQSSGRVAVWESVQLSSTSITIILSETNR